MAEPREEEGHLLEETQEEEVEGDPRTDTLQCRLFRMKYQRDPGVTDAVFYCL